MKILVICQYYYPEPFRVSDLCEEMAKRGHSVTVVTGTPNYPMGKIYDGYRGGEKQDEIVNGVSVHRCPLVARRSGIVYRLLNYFSFIFSSNSYVGKLKDDFDVVYVNQLSPVMMASAGITYKKKHHKKLVLYCLDLWPESLVVGGIKRGGLIYKFFHIVSKQIYKSADKILVSSRSFCDYFKKEFGIENAEYLPQYAEEIFDPEQCKKGPDEFIDLMFAGNIGVAQNVETIVKAAKLTEHISNLRWHIVGEGSEIDNIKKMTDGMEQIIFHGRHPLEEMPKYYAMADAMLVTMQKDPLISATLPGKIQTYMAAGKPIIGSIDGEASWVIETTECGLCSPAEDYQALADNISKFVDSEKKQLYGINSANAYQRMFSQTSFVDGLLKTLELSADKQKDEVN